MQAQLRSLFTWKSVLMISALALWVGSLFYSGYLELLMGRGLESTAAEPRTSGLRWELPSYDFGDIFIGETAVKGFALFNDTPVEQKIASVKSGCQCAEILEWPRLLPPNGNGHAVVRMSSSGAPGGRAASIVVRPADVKTCTPAAFNVYCNARAAISVEPSAVYVNAEYRPSQMVSLRSERTSEYISIERVTSQKELLRFSVEAIENGKDYRLTVTPLGEIPFGRISDTVIAHLQGSTQNRVTIPTLLVNESFLRAEPPYVGSPSNESHPGSFTVRIASKHPGQLEITDVTIQETSRPFSIVRLGPNEVDLTIQDLHANGNWTEMKVGTSVGVLLIPHEQ